MQPTSSQVSIIFIVGTAIMLLVFFFIALFVALYERKKQAYRFNLQRLEIENQKAMLEAVITAQENEKQYFAEELHDSIGQLLSAINMNLNNLSRLMTKDYEPPTQVDKILIDTKSITQTSIREIRAISQKMMPVVLSDFGLQAAIADLCTKTSEGGKLEVLFDYRIQDLSLNRETEKALFRISQELVNNTVKYASAQKINIEIYQTDTHLIYKYSDNGIGFNPGSSGKTGLGMKSIESRVNYLNGKLTLKSEKNSGMHVNIQLPKP
jgi:signal transduction histidine kinase